MIIDQSSEKWTNGWHSLSVLFHIPFTPPADCKKIYNKSQSTFETTAFRTSPSLLINTYWTRPRPIFKIIMLARSIVGDAVGGAHYWSRKHDNFDIGRGRVQISVLVSPYLLKRYNYTLIYWKSAISAKISIICHAPFLLWFEAIT